MELIMPYIPYIIVALFIIGGAVFYFMREKNALKNILLYLCGEAEKKYGGKTGTMKLHYVWGIVTERFKFLSVFLTFNQFQKMVVECLKGLRHLIETNPHIAGYINGDKTEGDSRESESKGDI